MLGTNHVVHANMNKIKATKEEKFFFFFGLVMVLLLILAGVQAFAGLPPTTVRGVRDTTSPTTFNIQVPNNSSARVGGTTAYISTGNKNLLLDPDFMDSTLTKWTPGTFQTQAQDINVFYNNPISRKVTITSMTTGSTDQFSQSIVLAPNLTGTNVEADVYLNTSMATSTVTFQLCIYEIGVQVACSAKYSGGGNWQLLQVFAPGAASSATYKYSIFVSNTSGSSVTGTFNATQAYLGPPTGLINITPSAQFLGSIEWAGAASASWTVMSTFPTFASYPANASSNTPVIKNSSFFTAPSTKIPGFIGNVQPGDYEFVVTGNIGIGATGFMFLKMTDGTTITNGIVTFSSTGQVSSGTFVYKFHYDTAQSNVPFSFQASGTASAPLNIYNADSGQNEFQITGKYFPSGNAQAAISPQQQANAWSGYFDSTCSWARTNTAYGDPTADATCNLVQRQNSNFGTVTAVAGILPGITFTPNYTGQYEICVNAYGAPNVTALGATLGAQLIDSNSVVISESVQSGLVTSNYQIFNNCSLANATAGAPYTLKIQTKASAGQITIGGNGGSAVEWSIYPITNAYPNPLLTGNVSSNSTGLERIERVFVASNCTTSPCTIANSSSSWVSSITRSAAGQYSVVLNGTPFSIAPTCTCSASFGTSAITCPTSPSTSSVGIITYSNNSTANDSGFNLICMGPR